METDPRKISTFPLAQPWQQYCLVRDGLPLHVSPDDLSPAERVEVQAWYVRAWHARRRRARYDQVHVAPPRKRYDVAGRLIAVDGQPCEPHIATWQEDRPKEPSAPARSSADH